MANLLGGISKRKNKFTSIPFQPEVKIRKNEINVFAAGASLIFCKDQRNNDYIICGNGLDENLEIMDQTKWQSFIQSGKETNSLNGHFLIIKISKDKIQIKNDLLGLREVFIIKQKDGIYFSSRLDWLIHYIEKPELNEKYLCSMWNFENPLLEESLLKDVQILKRNGKLTISTNKILKKNENWIPNKFDASISDIKNMISKILESLLDKNQVILGLSGGIDSRALLALLLKQTKSNWNTYTYGNDSIFDVRIAKSIAGKLKLKFNNLQTGVFDDFDFLDNWQEFVKETNATIPAFFYYDLNNYKLLPSNSFLIDGGKGEYLRRGLSNRLAILGKDALLQKNINSVSKYLFHKKPSLFNKRVTENWNDEISKQTENLLSTMPQVSEMNIDDWVDLYNIRYRTGNSGYITQTRLDCILPNLMPFIQPKVLEAVLNLPPKMRKNELIMKSILKSKSILKLFPLARYGTYIPFQYNKYTSLAWGKLVRNFIKERDKKIDIFLRKNREYNLSRISDISFKNSPVYDINHIKNSIEDYYSGKENDTELIVWWMTFDVWHKLLF